MCHNCTSGTTSAAGASTCTRCTNVACPLTVGGVCGQVRLSSSFATGFTNSYAYSSLLQQGCGTNQYWSHGAQGCQRCPTAAPYTFNPDQLCTEDIEACTVLRL